MGDKARYDEPSNTPGTSHYVQMESEDDNGVKFNQRVWLNVEDDSVDSQSDWKNRLARLFLPPSGAPIDILIKFGTVSVGTGAYMQLFKLFTQLAASSLTIAQFTLIAFVAVIIPLLVFLWLTDAVGEVSLYLALAVLVGMLIGW